MEEGGPSSGAQNEGAVVSEKDAILLRPSCRDYPVQQRRERAWNHSHFSALVAKSTCAAESFSNAAFSHANVGHMHGSRKQVKRSSLERRNWAPLQRYGQVEGWPRQSSVYKVVVGKAVQKYLYTCRASPRLRRQVLCAAR